MTLQVPEEYVDYLVALQADYKERGQRKGLIEILIQCIKLGDTAIHRSWEYAEKNKSLRQFSKQATDCFDANGQIKSPEKLRLLAIEHGLIKGMRLTPPSDPPEPSFEELESLTQPESNGHK
jgi:hypothetical protein